MQNIIEKLKHLTEQEFIQLTDRGNTSIESALSLAKHLGKTTVLIQNQGGWIHYQKAPGKIGLNLIELKTDYCLLDLEDLERNADKNSILLLNSMAGYMAIDDVEKIAEICKNKSCLFVNDVSGSIGTKYAKIGDIIIGSFGKWKPINLEYGGFIATNNEDYFTNLKLSKFDTDKYIELAKKLDNLHLRLDFFQKLRAQILKDLQDLEIIHKDKQGINVIIKFNNEEIKERIINYCNSNNFEFVECPKYIRVNEQAISIEVKRK